MFIKPQVATQQAPKKAIPQVFTSQVPKSDPFLSSLSYCVAAPPLPGGYVEEVVECKGEVKPSLRPWAVKSDDGRVVYHEPGKFGAFCRPRHNWLRYTGEVNVGRRKLAETALAYVILHNPHLVAAVLHKVSAGIVRYWMLRRQQLGYKADLDQKIAIQKKAPTYPVALQSLHKTKDYTHGPSSFGRMGNGFPALDLAVRQNLAALHGNSIPQTLNAHDNFLRVFCHLGPADLVPATAPSEIAKWLPNRRDKSPEATELKQLWSSHSASWKRLADLEEKVRPSSIFDENTPSVRGRAKGKHDAAATYAPGLLPIDAAPYLSNAWARLKNDWLNDRALPIELEDRKRGIDQFLPDPSSAFMKEVNAHNLIFAAGQSGTTSTLLQSAMLFGNLTSGEDLKTYLMAIVAYLVGGGMHSCHELFKTAQLVGIEYRVGEYDSAIPEHIRGHELYKKWKHEFADVIGPARFR